MGLEKWLGFGKKEDKPEPVAGNEGGTFMAIPKETPGGVTEAEGISAEESRRTRESLENLIVAIEANPDHPDHANLEEYRDQLRSLQ